MKGEIRGITLTHPWPYAILKWGKDVENRTWRPERQGGTVGMWLAIHGGAEPKGEKRTRFRLDLWAAMQKAGKLDTQSEIVQRRLYSGQQVGGEDHFIRPGIVAVGKLVEVRQDSPSPWAVQGQWHWCLEVTPLPEAVPHRGAQGLWQLNPEALEQVRAMYQKATA